MRGVMRWLLLLALPLVGCGASPASTRLPSGGDVAFLSPSPVISPSPSASPSLVATATPEPPPTLVAAGDIASCDLEGDALTAATVAELDPDAVATLGDHAYPAGSPATFAECYDPTWGAFFDRTYPAVGNNDVQDDGGAAYHAYFGERAGRLGEAWYSYDLGTWHIVVLDGNCELVGCAPGTPQHDWLVADLAASDAACTLAYWHQPRFTSGFHGDIVETGPFWEALDAAAADVVLGAHDHHYERFAPQAPDGAADPDGIRQFIVGTGGGQLYPAIRQAPNSERMILGTVGVLELTLHPDSYDWRFVTGDGSEADGGSGDCR